MTGNEGFGAYGLVYFCLAAESGWVKIGWTGGPLRKRKDRLQTGCPHDHVIVGTMPGTREAEKELHHRLAAWRGRGEWFLLADEVVDCIAEVSAPLPKEFAQLVEMEPRLRRVWANAIACHRGVQPEFCANAVWYGDGFGAEGLKHEMQRLVGWLRPEKHPELSTKTAYDVALETLYGLLPGCRDCACVRLEWFGVGN